MTEEASAAGEEKPGWHILNREGDERAAKTKKWGPEQIEEWRSTRAAKRSYEDEVLARIRSWGETADGDGGRFDVKRIGALSHDEQGSPTALAENGSEEEEEEEEARYPVYAIRTRDWSPSKPCVLVTGGVHGYERSGVQGALRFLDEEAERYAGLGFNVMVVPCVSPWAYETVQRWNARGVDPNRSFNPEGEVVPGRNLNPEPETEESRILIDHLAKMRDECNVERWLLHVDCHETTDTDASEFGPSKAARDGAFVRDEVFGPGGAGDPETIPDGFYVYADEATLPEQAGFYAAMLNAVRKVTHIAPSGKFDIEDLPNAADFGLEGVGGLVVTEAGEDVTIGACAGATKNAKYFTTTEVYPDSKSRTVTDDQCDRAQVACITAALDYLLEVEMTNYDTTI